MKALFVTCLALAALTATFSARAERPLRIQDLTALEERGLSAEEVSQELAVSASFTYPDQVTSGNNPNMYMSGNTPNGMTSGNWPNGLTHGNYPNVYTQGNPLFGTKAGEIPMPHLNF